MSSFCFPFAAAITLHDLALEDDPSQLGHLQLNLAGLGMHSAAVAAGPDVGTVGRSFVAFGAVESHGLGIE